MEKLAKEKQENLSSPNDLCYRTTSHEHTYGGWKSLDNQEAKEEDVQQLVSTDSLRALV